MRTFLGTWLLVAGATPIVAAPPELDPEAKRPYVWRVVIQTAAHPNFTPEFRERLGRDVRAALQPVLGEGGQVEVVDLASLPQVQWEPLWKRLATEGWEALEREEFRTISGIKTHFLKIDVREGNTFHLATRQHDGSTGLTSPLVRTKQTTSGETVGRLAGVLIGKDFGPIGTVERNYDDPSLAQVRFKAGEIGPFHKWVREGDILAFSIIFKQPKPAAPEPKAGSKPAPEEPPSLGGKPQEFTLLRVKSTLPDGVCQCQVLTRFKQPFVGGRDVIGYRCMKLTTQNAPLQLRILGSDGEVPPPTSPLELWAADSSFLTTPGPRDTLERRGTLYRTGRPLQNVGLVVVKIGASRTEAFPIPVLGDEQEPITLRFAINAEELARAEFEQACERLRGRTLEALSAQVALYKNLGQLIRNGENATALNRATAGLTNTLASEAELTAELERLKKSTAGTEYTQRLLASSAEQLKVLGAAKPEIEKKIAELKEAAVKANDPIKYEREFRAGELTRQIAYRVGRGEVPEALDLYDQLFELTQQDEAKTLKAALAKRWAPQSDEHRKARQFVLEDWRAATTVEALRDAAIKLAEVVPVLAAHSDSLGLRNVATSIQTAYARLKESLDRLDENREADRPAIKQVKDVADAVRKIEESVLASLKKLEPPPKEKEPGDGK